MAQNSFLRVLEIFFIEPTSIHFIKEIGKKIKLAPTSVRKHVKELKKLGLIMGEKANPFNGYIANRENDDFIFYKRVYNLYSLKELKDFLISFYYPKLIVVYGSYSLGEDMEASDIDLFILTKTKKEANVKKFEEKLKRNVHIICAENVNKLEEKIQNKIYNGITLYGGF